MKILSILLFLFLVTPLLSIAQKDYDHRFHLYAYSGYGFSIEDDTDAFDFSVHSYFNASYDINKNFDVGVPAGLDYNIYSPDNPDLIFTSVIDNLVFLPVGVEIGYSISNKFRWSIMGGRVFNITTDPFIEEDATFIASNFA
jgi:hypothetical protein